jgi:hypothetical protein
VIRPPRSWFSNQRHLSLLTCSCIDADPKKTLPIANGMGAGPARMGQMEREKMTVKKVLQFIILFTAAVALAQTAPVPPPIYGNGWQAFEEGLENLRVGPDGPKFDIRFRAEQNDKVKSATIFIKTGSGYSGGNGGTLRLSLQTDDGSANHFPTGNEMDSSSFATQNQDSLHEFPFSGSASLTAGTLYHIVVTNTDSSPNSNFVSMNNMWNSAGANPYYSFTDWAVLWMQSSTWSLKTNSTPICAIKYAGGTSQGNGYVDSPSISELFNIQGSNTVGENFTVSGSDKVVSSVHFHIRASGAPGPLTVTLYSGSTVVERGTIPASAVTASTVYAYATYNFTQPRTLSKGSSYLIELSSSGSGSYQTHPMIKGFRDGLDVPSEFHDGDYEVNGNQNPTEDMKMYFTTVGGTRASQPPPAPTGLTAVVQ